MDKIKFKGKYFTDHKNAVHLSDARVQEMINDVVGMLKKSKEQSDFAFCATGDTIVFGFVFHAEEEMDDEMSIIVSQSYSLAELYKDEKLRWRAVEWNRAKREELEEELKQVDAYAESLRRQLRAQYNPRKEV